MNSATQQIEAHLVLSNVRLGSISHRFGGRMLLVESAIYEFLDSRALDYRGVHWCFYELTNGGFYMAPQAATAHVAVAGEAAEGEMSSDAAGIAAFLFAFSRLAFRCPEDERFARHFDKLSDFARGHAEAGKIFRAIE